VLRSRIRHSHPSYGPYDSSFQWCYMGRLQSFRGALVILAERSVDPPLRHCTVTPASMG
jgi:hypothetical protein